MWLLRRNAQNHKRKKKSGDGSLLDRHHGQEGDESLFCVAVVFILASAVRDGHVPKSEEEAEGSGGGHCGGEGLCQCRHVRHSGPPTGGDGGRHWVVNKKKKRRKKRKKKKGWMNG